MEGGFPGVKFQLRRSAAHGGKPPWWKVMVSEFYRELQSPEGLKSIHLCSKPLAFVCYLFFSLHRTQKINSVNKRHQFSPNRGRKFDNWPRYIVHFLSQNTPEMCQHSQIYRCYWKMGLGSC